ncbi:MAG: hypothetical protein LBM96_06900 [Methanobrevibacter sp.]|jgi:predicted  nucleic acid-binding Zn-ribbon protein|nr:hypothetical protein [Candidatus Methanoflexus mossambicus]
MNICAECGNKIEQEDFLKGCSKCGSKKFRFIDPDADKKEEKKRLKQIKEEKKQVESSLNESDVESIKVNDKGVYELNLSQLLEGETDIYKNKDGEYGIAIDSLLKKQIKGENGDK